MKKIYSIKLSASVAKIGQDQKIIINKKANIIRGKILYRGVIIIFWYFILGMFFIEFIYPICESICTIILSYLERIKGKLTVDITKTNLKLQKMAEPPDSSTHVIGFSIDTDEEEEEDDL